MFSDGFALFSMNLGLSLEAIGEYSVPHDASTLSPSGGERKTPTTKGPLVPGPLSLALVLSGPGPGPALQGEGRLMRFDALRA